MKGGTLRNTKRQVVRGCVMLAGAAVLVLAPLVLAHGSRARPTTPQPSSTASQLLAANVRSTSVHHTFFVGPVWPSTDQPRRLPGTFLPVVHHATVRVHTVTVTPHRTVSTPTEPVSDTNEKIGTATWYAWHPGQCAVHYLPKGTRIWVKDLDTGKVITCLVTDFEQDGSRAVDLDTQQFAELAPLSQGVIRVEVTW